MEISVCQSSILGADSKGAASFTTPSYLEALQIGLLIDSKAPMPRVEGSLTRFPFFQVMFASHFSWD